MNYRYFAIFCLLALISCRYQKHKEKSSFKNNDFEKSTAKSLTDEKFEITLYDKEVDSLISLYPNHLDNYTVSVVSCKNLNDKFLEIYEKDQYARNAGIGDIKKVDEENLIKFISLVETCGFPVGNEIKDFRGYLGIFVVLQHSEPSVIAYYYHDFKNLILLGKLPKDFLALLQDRFLLLNNVPQLYGTQIHNGKLYKLSNPNSLKERRANMEFTESIEDYLLRYGLNLEEELKRLSLEN